MAEVVKYDLSWPHRAGHEGAASGIGLATVRMLANNGATVAVNFLPGDPRGPQAVAAMRQSGGSAIDAPGNVGIADDAVAMVDDAIRRLGRLDLLVNNAATPGVGVAQFIDPGRLDLIDDALWETQLPTNLAGVFRCCKAAAPALKLTKGAIVSVSSVAGIDEAGSSLVYGAMKAGAD